MLFTLQLSLPRDARFVGLLRNLARCVFEDVGVPEEETEDIRVALTEACANAVRHATGSTEYSVGFSIDADGCTIEVVDLGPGFDFPMIEDLGEETLGADADTETGRGLLLMRALVDDLEFTRQEDGTSVTLRKTWPEVSLSLAGDSSSSNA